MFEDDHVHDAVELRQQRQRVLQGGIPGLGHVLHEHLREEGSGGEGVVGGSGMVDVGGY